ncbi:MAG: Methyltransferase domain protein [Syntrophorhabdus sp. PtaU1.Bin050]|nr:MAG: Methyltransferase domain protein [Syntrophorhabdus sp. PtaU1.Bin050]
MILEGYEMKEVDWLELWRELVTRSSQLKEERLVKRYKRHARKQMEKQDSLLDFVLREAEPQDTAIDIGPGTGRWTIPLAKTIGGVTDIEPTSAMVEMLKENLDNVGLYNVEIIPQTWEDATPSMHDIVLCAHGMYGSLDLAAFVRKMERFSRKRCYLVLRLPPANGIMAELSLNIYGCRHDSPNAVIAYNALYVMGIDANALVENEIVNWEDTTLEDAFNRAKKRLHLEESGTTYDELIHSTIDRRLSLVNGLYTWPDGMRSALLWWSPDKDDDDRVCS